MSHDQLHAVSHAAGAADALVLDDHLSSQELTSGESTMNRLLAYNNNASLGASGRIRFTYFTARKTETITQVTTYTGGTAAGATPTLCRVGIYTVAGNGDLTLVASIANDTALWAAQNTAYTRSLSGGNLSKVAGQRYAVGILVVTAAALPTFIGQLVGGDSGGFRSELALAPRLTSELQSQTDLTSPASGALTTTGSAIYCALLP